MSKCLICQEKLEGYQCLNIGPRRWNHSWQNYSNGYGFSIKRNNLPGYTVNVWNDNSECATKFSINCGEIVIQSSQPFNFDFSSVENLIRQIEMLMIFHNA